MATQARNPHPVSILESVAPRVTSSAERPASGSSGRSAIGLSSIAKATGALSAPVMGLIALAAIGAAGAGVGAGLRSGSSTSPGTTHGVVPSGGNVGPGGTLIVRPTDRPTQPSGHHQLPYVPGNGSGSQPPSRGSRPPADNPGQGGSSQVGQ